MEKYYLNGKSLSLIEGEKVEAKLRIKSSGWNFLKGDCKHTFLLTNRRIIQAKSSSGLNEITMTGIDDISGTSIKVNNKQVFSLLWGLLGVAGGIALYYVLQSSFGSTAVSVFFGFLSVLLGLILVIDYIVSKGEKTLIIYSGSCTIIVEANDDQTEDIEGFADKIFEMKAKRVSEDFYRSPGILSTKRQEQFGEKIDETSVFKANAEEHVGKENADFSGLVEESPPDSYVENDEVLERSKLISDQANREKEISNSGTTTEGWESHLSSRGNTRLEQGDDNQQQQS